MGRPKGAEGRDKEWRAAIRVAVRELREAGPEDRAKSVKALRLLARKLVDKALGGDVMAMREIGDRLDGKAVQGVEVGGTITYTSIERTIVDPATEAAEAEETVH